MVSNAKLSHDEIECSKELGRWVLCELHFGKCGIAPSHTLSWQAFTLACARAPWPPWLENNLQSLLATSQSTALRQIMGKGALIFWTWGAQHAKRSWQRNSALPTACRRHWDASHRFDRLCHPIEAPIWCDAASKKEILICGTQHSSRATCVCYLWQIKASNNNAPNRNKSSSTWLSSRQHVLQFFLFGVVLRETCWEMLRRFSFLFSFFPYY